MGLPQSMQRRLPVRHSDEDRLIADMIGKPRRSGRYNYPARRGAILFASSNQRQFNKKTPRVIDFSGVPEIGKYSAIDEEVSLMKIRICIFMCATAALAACTDMPISNGAPSDQFIQELPEGVLAIAAPYQDLNAVKIETSDGCYVYRHVGPVETTFLPLRSQDGRPICTRTDEAIQTS